MAVACFGLLVLAAAWQRQTLDWEWGLVESKGVRIRQSIARGGLPEHEPATLHIRIAAPLLPSEAGLEILGPRGERLAEIAPGPSAFLTIALPARLLEENRRGPVSIELVARGDYDEFHYQLFPIVPPPWAGQAHRVGDDQLSPASGVASGALDWWAHAGSD